MKRKILITLLVILIFFVSGVLILLYVNTKILPAKIKALAAQKIEEVLGRRAAIDSVDFSFPQGFVLHHFVLYEKDSPEILCSIEQISFNILPWSVLKDKKVIIPSLRVEKPILKMKHLKNNTFNITDLLTPKNQDQKSSYSLYVGELVVTGGHMNFSDETITPVFNQGMDNIALKANFSLPKNLKFRFSGNLSNTNTSHISLDGNYDISTQKIKAALHIEQLPFQNYLSFFTNLNSIKIENGILKSLDASATWQYGKLDLQSAAEFNNLNLTASSGIRLLGNPSLHLSLKYDSLHGDLLFYDTFLTLNGVTVSNVPSAGEISNLNGQIRYTNDKLIFQELMLNAYNTPMTASGTVENFAEPSLDLKVDAPHFDLSRLKSILPDMFTEKRIDAAGDAAISLSYKGPAQPIALNHLKGNIILNNATFKTEKLPDAVTNITGKIEAAQDDAAWQQLKGNFQNKTYQIDGTLKNFSEPAVETTLISDDLNLKTSFKIANQILDFSSLSGKYFHSDIDLKGNFNSGNHNFTFNGGANVDLNDIPKILPQFEEKFKSLKLSGLCSLEGTVAGQDDNWKNWKTSLSLSSPSLTMSGYHASNVSLHLDQSSQHINRLELTGNIYDGALDVLASADLTEENIPCSLTFHLENLDIAKFKEDSAWRGKDVSGLLSLELSAKGPSARLQDIEGEGTVTIHDGNLWQFDLFEGLGKVLPLREFQTLTFKEGKADFTISNQKISTTNGELSSDLLALLVNGWIDFSKHLNLEVTLHFNEDTLSKAGGLLKASALFGELTSVTISGTLDHRIYTPILGSLIKNTGTLLKEGLKEGLKNIFSGSN